MPMLYRGREKFGMGDLKTHELSHIKGHKQICLYSESASTCSFESLWVGFYPVEPSTFTYFGNVFAWTGTLNFEQCFINLMSLSNLIKWIYSFASLVLIGLDVLRRSTFISNELICVPLRVQLCTTGFNTNLRRYIAVQLPVANTSMLNTNIDALCQKTKVES